MLFVTAQFATRAARAVEVDLAALEKPPAFARVAGAGPLSVLTGSGLAQRSRNHSVGTSIRWPLNVGVTRGGVVSLSTAA